jgi:hypothetical protein
MYSAIDQSRTVLAGIPLATLQLWQPRLQAALLNTALGQNPVSLSYAQGDGSKSITYNITSFAQARSLLDLVNRLLGNPPSRRAMRPIF